MRKRASWDKEQSILSMHNERSLTETEWDYRQKQLGIPLETDILEMHEIVFLERFIQLGNHYLWIAKQPKNHQPTNDFHWIETNLDMELKSMSSLKYRSISLRISDAASKAAKQGFVKDNFIVDLGNSLIPTKLHQQLRRYNKVHDIKIKNLFLLSKNGIDKINIE